jgi:hypothetical protein
MVLVIVFRERHSDSDIVQEGTQGCGDIVHRGHKAVTAAFRLFPSSSGVSALVETLRLEVRLPRSNPRSAASFWMTWDQ